LSALYPYLVAIVGIALMMTVWVLVQLAWRRTFPNVGRDEDVLAGRSGCHGCAQDGHCDKQTASLADASELDACELRT
jgi:hypothetical protein